MAQRSYVTGLPVGVTLNPESGYIAVVVYLGDMAQALDESSDLNENPAELEADTEAILDAITLGKVQVAWSAGA